MEGHTLGDKAGCKLFSMTIMIDTPRGGRGVGDEVGEMDSGWIKAMLPESM